MYDSTDTMTGNLCLKWLTFMCGTVLLVFGSPENGIHYNWHQIDKGRVKVIEDYSAIWGKYDYIGCLFVCLLDGLTPLSTVFQLYRAWRSVLLVEEIK